MKIKDTITERDFDQIYDLIIIVTFIAIAMGIVWRFFIA